MNDVLTQVDKGPPLVNISIVLIQSSPRLSSSLATLANCKASKGIWSLKLAFGPALFTRQMDRKGVISSPAPPEWGTLGISGWGYATGTLEPLTYTRASSAEFCYPLPEQTPQIPPILE